MNAFSKRVEIGEGGREGKREGERREVGRTERREGGRGRDREERETETETYLL